MVFVKCFIVLSCLSKFQDAHFYKLSDPIILFQVG